MPILSDLLDLFPDTTHPVFLVSDPDNLLNDEAVLSLLLQRGFQIVQESDSILFRYRIEQLKPFDLSNPVLVITADMLENLPYDLWQQGQQVQLALHEFFPNLAYPVIRTLTSAQRARLAQLVGPKERLGEQKTIQFVLEHVFHFTSRLLDQPAHFVLWLDEFHTSLAPLPPLLLESVLEHFRHSENYQGWDINALLQDRETFRLFIQHQWQGFLSIQTGKSFGEAGGAYFLHFETNLSLQDTLLRLLRNSSLMPVQLEVGRPLPAWVVPGILTLDEDHRLRGATELFAQLRETFATLTAESRWEEWKAVAYQWAELTSLQNEMGIPTNEERDEYTEIQAKLDAVFNSWLTDKYSSLATQKLPTPHHVPHYMNYLRSQGLAQKLPFW